MRRSAIFGLLLLVAGVGACGRSTPAARAGGATSVTHCAVNRSGLVVATITVANNSSHLVHEAVNALVDQNGTPLGYSDIVTVAVRPHATSSIPALTYVRPPPGASVTPAGTGAIPVRGTGVVPVSCTIGSVVVYS